MHHDLDTRMSVFEKFGGIRPMAAKLGLAHSTVKAWHYAGSIPEWRHDLILRKALEAKINITVAELKSVVPDSQPFRRGRPAPTERAA